MWVVVPSVNDYLMWVVVPLVNDYHGSYWAYPSAQSKRGQ
jgi:hypothetical protein